jgi:hypothetical protein
MDPLKCIEYINQFSHEPNSLDKILSTRGRINLITWFVNFLQADQKFLESCIILLDKIPGLYELDICYQQILALSSLQLVMKLNHVEKFNPNKFDSVLKNLRCNKLYALKKEVYNMAEIFLCNQLEWNFSNTNITETINTTLAEIKITDRETLKKFITKILPFALTLFNTACVNLHELSFVVLFIALDQFIPIQEKLIMQPEFVSVINDLVIQHGVSLANIILMKHYLTQFINNLQNDYAVAVGNSERILNEYRLLCATNGINNINETNIGLFILMNDELNRGSPIR